MDNANRRRLKAITYYADDKAIASEHGLPADYVSLSIEAVTATKDPDANRDKRNGFS